MKKLLVVTGLVLSSILSYGQDKELIIKRATSWFESVYVPKNLYDPYSYKRMKAWVEKYTMSDYYNDKNNELDIQIKELNKELFQYHRNHYLFEEKFSNPKKNWLESDIKELIKKNEYEERISYVMSSLKKSENKIDSLNKTSLEFTNKLNSMTMEEHNKLHHYIVRIDAYVKDESGRESLKKYSIDYYNLPNNKYKISKDK
jgi:hypothetical protein